MGGMSEWTAHAVEGVPALGVCCDEQEVGVSGHVCSFSVGAGFKPALSTGPTGLGR